MPADFSVGTHSASGNPRGFYCQPTARRQTLGVSPSPQPESWSRKMRWVSDLVPTVQLLGGHHERRTISQARSAG